MTGNCGLPEGVEHPHMDRCYSAGRSELEAELRAIIAAPDDTQWWPVEPYADPSDPDEVVEVQVVNVNRLRELLGGGA